MVTQLGLNLTSLYLVQLVLPQLVELLLHSTKKYARDLKVYQQKECGMFVYSLTLYHQIRTSGAAASPGNGVGGATGVGSLAVELAGALSATVTFSSPGMDANYEVNIGRFYSEITVCCGCNEEIFFSDER